MGLQQINKKSRKVINSPDQIISQKKISPKAI